MRLVMVTLCVFGLLVAGCATGTKKQAVQPASYDTKSQKTYQPQATVSNYDNEDTFSSELNDQPTKKTSAESGTQLSTRQIQRALKNAGFYKGQIDGKIGSKTKESIARFQKEKGLKADGIAGKRTIAELRKYLK